MENKFSHHFVVTGSDEKNYRLTDDAPQWLRRSIHMSLESDLYYDNNWILEVYFKVASAIDSGEIRSNPNCEFNDNDYDYDLIVQDVNKFTEEFVTSYDDFYLWATENAKERWFISYKKRTKSNHDDEDDGIEFLRNIMRNAVKVIASCICYDFDQRWKRDCKSE